MAQRLRCGGLARSTKMIGMAVLSMLVLYLVAVTAVVMMWRGLWGLLDEYVWPKNPKLSYWSTFIIGFILIVSVLALI